MSSSQNETTLPKLCLICKDMYGNPVFQDMCSKCFKEFKATKEPRLKDEFTLSQKLINNEEKHLKEVKEEKKLEEQIQAQEKRIIIEVSKPELSGTEEKEKKNTGRCNSCNKKVGILGYECKHCTETFCKFHRLPEEHLCEVNFIEIGKKKLQEENPVVCLAKIEKI